MTNQLSFSKPIKKPNNPNFSCGPCRKYPSWALNDLTDAVLGRSHRSKDGKQKLAELINKTRNILNIPDDYRIAIVPASDTGAVEMALWSLLGPKQVDVFAWESFSKGWLTDVVKQLKLNPTSYVAEYGQITDFAKYNSDNDSVFVFNGTTSGVRIANLDWISNDRKGLTICDATSAVFSQHIDFKKLDVITWSWQKALGGEAAHGMLVLSPNAVARLESYTPAWPMPKIFRMTKDSKLIEGIFKGETINTPSMLCVEDCLVSLNWIESIGGVKATQQISDNSLEVLRNWVAKSAWVDFLANDSTIQSNTSVCLKIKYPEFCAIDAAEQKAMVKKVCQLLEDENVALDINSYKDAPLGFRIWTGATVPTADVEALLPWLDWAFSQVINSKAS